MIRILIADDSEAVRDALTSLLKGAPDLELVGTAGDGREVVEMAKELLPDVVIVDAQMPVMDGVDATRLIKHAVPHVGVLFFSVFAEDREAAMKAGADVCLLKDCEPEHLFAELARIGRKAQAAKNAMTSQECVATRQCGL